MSAAIEEFQLKTNGQASDAIERLQRVVSDFVDSLGNLGALVVVDVEGAGRISLTAGHSDLERTRAVHAGDLYQIGSQSKTVTAMALLLMSRDGLLDLDDPVVSHLELPIDARITVRHLLMNSSGLGEYTWPLFSVRPDPRISYAPRDLVALALPQGQVFEPGDRFDYCNTGWVIAALVIEALSGKPYRQVVNERIVMPLGLNSAGFGGSVPKGELMRCYMSLPVASRPIDTTTCLSWAFGAGDGIASANDIMTIYKSLTNPRSPLGVSMDDVAAETKRPGVEPVFPMSLGAEYGLGLERRAWAGREVWGHPGSTLACRSSTWVDAGRGIAVATCVTGHIELPGYSDELRYPRAQLFSMALNTAYTLAATSKQD